MLVKLPLWFSLAAAAVAAPSKDTYDYVSQLCLSKRHLSQSTNCHVLTLMTCRILHLKSSYSSDLSANLDPS